MFMDDENEENCFLDFKNTTLTTTIKQKAKRELGESEEKTEECLKKFVEKIKGIKNLNCQMDEPFLMKFLRARKFQCEKALKVLCEFYSHRKNYPHLYEDIDPEFLEFILSKNACNFSSVRTKAGCAIWIVRLGLWDPTSMNPDDMFRFGNICMQNAMDNPVTQICGLVTIFDFNGYGWSHQVQFTLSRMYSYLTAIQDAIPYRTKEFHVINHSKLFTILYAIIRPFLKEKIRKRIFLHGNSLESLHKYVSPEALPQEFGGTLGPLNNDDFYNTIRQSQQASLHSNRKFGFL